MTAHSGAVLLCEGLVACGARIVFGVPGTQNVTLFEALRRSRLRTILTTSELTATLMAGAYARMTGSVGVVVTIPGPGFAFAVPGLAEAFLDSAPVLHITGLPATGPGRHFQLQALDQRAMADPVVKAVRDVTTLAELAAAVPEEWARAASGEPGPVVLQVASSLLGADAGSLRAAAPSLPTAAPLLDDLMARVREAQQPLVLAGQGAVASSALLARWTARGGIPVLTTPSGRGVIPEDHPLCLGFDPLRSDPAAVNEICAAADLILVLGCKLSHNGTSGFHLRLPADRLVHVDTSVDVLGANYPAALMVCAGAEDVLTALNGVDAPASRWVDGTIAEWRAAIRTPCAGDLPEPAVAGVPSGAPGDFFAALRRALPRHGVVVTDSGMHQILTRRYFDVLAPRGLLLPSDLQTMGFGIPAAVAAKLAVPERPVTVVVGDGGLAVTGTELLTAAREGLALVAVVFDDGYLNQIRLQQLRDFGRTHAVTLGPLNVAAFAAAVGADYLPVGEDVESTVRDAHGAKRPVVVHVPVGDSTAVMRQRASSAVREGARRAMGPGLTRWLKSLKP